MIPVVVIMGPTAAGKSEIGVFVSEEIGGEIINADSMQVYKHLKIGTAFPTEEMLKRVPHHLFGVLELDQHPDAGWYANRAAAVIKALWNKGKVPVLVGGTFFWIKVLLEGIADVPKVPHLNPEDFESPYETLKKVDPELAARLRPTDTQRIMRGLEVFFGTGRPLSWYHSQGLRRFGDFQAFKVWVDLPRPELYQRINSRLEQMLQEGLVEEVRRVLAMGYSPDIAPLRVGSYRYVVKYVLGEVTFEQMKEKTAQEHRNYARRQLVWLRREERENKVVRLPKDRRVILNAVQDFLKSLA